MCDFMVGVDCDYCPFWDDDNDECKYLSYSEEKREEIREEYYNWIAEIEGEEK